MNKSEKKIILNQYKETLNLIRLGFDYKKVVKKDMSFLLNNLGLKKEKIEIENNFEMNKREWNYIKRDTFKNLFNYFLKINIILDFSLFDHFNDNLEIDCCHFTNEVKKCVKACYKILNEQ